MIKVHICYIIVVYKRLSLIRLPMSAMFEFVTFYLLFLFASLSCLIQKSCNTIFGIIIVAIIIFYYFLHVNYFFFYYYYYYYYYYFTTTTSTTTTTTTVTTTTSSGLCEISLTFPAVFSPFSLLPHFISPLVICI